MFEFSICMSMPAASLKCTLKNNLLLHQGRHGWQGPQGLGPETLAEIIESDPLCIADKKLKKPPKKVAYLWQLGGFFLCSPTAQNSPELHFRFINSFIQPSRVGSLIGMF